ncbi:MAG: hypothetical protein KF878_24720 [Planctomycetes bacterium]|nr:hypothetical protein [Planctomycetota bacterium]
MSRAHPGTDTDGAEKGGVAVGAPVVDAPPWSSPLPSRHRRRRQAIGLALALAAGSAFAGGRATREASPPRTERALDVDRAAHVADAARVRLVALAGERVLTVRAEGSRLLVAYDVDAIRVEFPAPSPSFGDERGPTLLDPEKLCDIVDEKLGEDSDHASEVAGGVLLVRGTLAQQVTTARLLAALVGARSAREEAEQLARARLSALVGDRLLSVRVDNARWLRVALDVSGILAHVPDFPAPEISLNLALGGGGGGGSGVLTFADEDESGCGLDADKLVEIIEEKLGEDSDCVVELHGGLLLLKGGLGHQERVGRLVRALDQGVCERSPIRCPKAGGGR